MSVINLCPGSAEVNQIVYDFMRLTFQLGEREKNNEQINICQVVINAFSYSNYLTNIRRMAKR